LTFYPYGGFEFYFAAAAAGGKFFAGGSAQEGFTAAGPFILARYDAAGTFEDAVTEPGSTVGSNSCCQGESRIRGMRAIGGDLYTTGTSRLTGAGEDDVTRPALMRFDTSLNRAWKARSPDREGVFYDVALLGSGVFVVGETGNAPSRDFLIERYDASGNRQWSVTHGSSGDNALVGVVALSGRLFAVGSTDETGAGGYDAVVVELDPNSGAILATTHLGGAENDAAAGVVTDGQALWVAGTTRSYASADGNAVGDADLALWRVPVS
jgi:hypothetical protein